ncbi:MAG: type II toxin-antitoxin system RelE/ParE family toxin [Patescibacteria group bacterium]
MLEIDLSKVSEKFLKKLPPKQRRQVAEKVYTLAENPQASDTSLLRGYEEYYRADIGEYRIIYRWSKECLHVTLIGKRNDGDVYRKLKRMRG